MEVQSFMEVTAWRHARDLNCWVSYIVGFHALLSLMHCWVSSIVGFHALLRPEGWPPSLLPQGDIYSFWEFEGVWNRLAFCSLFQSRFLKKVYAPRCDVSWSYQSPDPFWGSSQHRIIILELIGISELNVEKLCATERWTDACRMRGRLHLRAGIAELIYSVCYVWVRTPPLVTMHSVTMPSL